MNVKTYEPHPGEPAVNTNRCRARINTGARWTGQCGRRAHGEWCTTHNPEAVARKNAATEARRAERSDTRRNLRLAPVQEFKDEVLALLDTVAGPGGGEHVAVSEIIDLIKCLPLETEE